jgi:predicted ATPase
VEAGGGQELPALFVELAAERGPTLLVLDNFEQVIDAAPTVGELLAACPELTALVTSREVLRLQAEHDFPLQPLALPPVDELPAVEELEHSPAVALFVDRARATDPTFALTPDNAAAVAELCARLDGLPLALELAAVRVRTLTPEAMLERLESRLKLLTSGARDLPDRQRTLRQAIDWSYELLEPPEQLVFQRLAVFPGGFTLEAAEAVADPFGRLERDVAEIVGSLLDKSLLVRSSETAAGSRFALLETVREYALERLAAGEDEALVRKAHVAYFLVLGEEADVVEGGRKTAAWMEQLRLEQHNFRAALDWTVAHDSAEWGLQIAQGLFHFWEHGEDTSEGRRRFAELLALSSAQEPTVTRAKSLFCAAGLAWLQGDLKRARGLQQEVLEIHRQLGDRRAEAVSLNAGAIYDVDEGRYEEAKDAYEQCLDLWRELGDIAGYNRSLSNYASVLRQEGDLERARQLYKEAAARFEQAGDRSGAAWEASHEGDVAREQGDVAAAAILYERALAAFRDQEDLWGVGSALNDLGDVAREQGDAERATDLYGEALGLFAALGHRRGAARTLEALAVTAETQGRWEHTLLLAAAAAAVRSRNRSQTPEELTAVLAAAVERARAELDGDVAEAVRRRGARMSFDQAVEAAAGG